MGSPEVKVQRTSPSSVLFTSYNLLNLFAGDSAEARQPYEMITTVIRALGTDVLAVQEILAPDGDTAARRRRRSGGRHGRRRLRRGGEGWNGSR